MEESLKTVRIVKIPVSALLDRNGVIAHDITASDGSFIVPAGVDMSIFSEASVEHMVRRLSACGIDFVHMRLDPLELTDDQINSIIDKIYTEKDILVSKKKAAGMLKAVDGLFKNFETFGAGAASDSGAAPVFNENVVEQVSNISTGLAYDIMNNPSVAFSLCKVRDADEYTFIHSFNVAMLMGCLATRVRPNDRRFVERVVLGGLMHDIGKSQIPLKILNKPAPLDDDEFAVMKQHPLLGVTLASDAGMKDRDVLDMIGMHHEKWNGSGYPFGLSGSKIREEARVAAVADVFDALTAERCYKGSMTSRDAVTAILNGAGTHFDGKIGHELLVMIGLYPPGSVVRLSDGREGIVVSSGGEDLMRPTIMLHGKGAGDDVPIFVNLREESNIRITDYFGHSGKRFMDR